MKKACKINGVPEGATISVETCWRLAKLWYSDRLNVNWRTKSAARVKTIFDSVNLKGNFWSV